MPYVYVPSKEVCLRPCSHATRGPALTCTLLARSQGDTRKRVQELANAGQTKRPTSCLMVLRDAPKGGEADAGLAELYSDVEAKLTKLDA